MNSFVELAGVRGFNPHELNWFSAPYSQHFPIRGRFVDLGALSVGLKDGREGFGIEFEEVGRGQCSGETQEESVREGVNHGQYFRGMLTLLAEPR